METYQRSFETNLSTEDNSISGRVFAWDTPSPVDGKSEVIPRECEIETSSNTLALLSHKKEFPLGRLGKNLSFEKRPDGFYFKIKGTDSATFKEAKTLVKNGIIHGCSPKFVARPIYEGNKRLFNKIRISEVSLTSNPAYQHSFTQAREKTNNPTLKHRPPECF